MCTTAFVRLNDHLLLGQNYDFYYGHGLIMTNQRGLHKRTIGRDKTITWVSKHGSLTFNQFGKELPISGLNDAGLSVAMMWHDEGVYPQPDKRKPLNELQWIQYQLDNYSEVAQVLEKIDEFRIEKTMYPLHYSLCDSEGQSAIVEFIEGSAVIEKNPRLHVLTNSSYSKSLDYANKHRDIPTSELSRAVTSLDRFVLAHRLLNETFVNNEIDPIEALFSVLGKVSLQPTFGSAFQWMGKGMPRTITQWTIVYDVLNGRVFFRTLKNKKTREINTRVFDFSCKNVPKILDVNSPSNGDVTHSFRFYSREENFRIIQTTYKHLVDQFPIEAQEEFASYPETFECME